MQVRSVFYFSKIRNIRNFTLSFHYAMKSGIISYTNWSHGLKTLLLKIKTIRIILLQNAEDRIPELCCMDGCLNLPR
jgi:hypothetical protein